MSSVKVSLSQYKQPILVIITIIQVIIMLYYFKIENSIQDVKLKCYAYPDKFIEHGSVEELEEKYIKE